MTNIDMGTLPEAEHEKFHRFLARVNEATAEVFEDSDHPAVVVGVQFGSMGLNDESPTCAVSSNLPVCSVLEALEDMTEFAAEQHRQHHGRAENEVEETIPLSQVPPEVREALTRLAADLGVSPDQIDFIQVADTSDLAGLPEFHADDEAESKSESEG